MAGVKRFITYMFAYENGVKAQNTGFVKTEIRGEECRLSVYLQGISTCSAGSGCGVCRLFFFREEDQMLVCFPIGELNVMAGRGERQIALRQSDIAGSGHGISEMDGLLLTDSNSQIWMSRWTDRATVEVAAGRIKIWSLDSGIESETGSDVTELNNATETEVTVEHGTVNEATSGIDAATVIAVDETTVTEENKTVDTIGVTEQEREQELGAGSEQESVSAPENAVKSGGTTGSETVGERKRTNEMGISLPALWEEFTKDREILSMGTGDMVSIQISLPEIRRFPRAHWNLGTNGFLLQGYMNYRYLVLLREGESFKLGVPGVSDAQERVMAAVFGFPEFVMLEEVSQIKDSGTKNAQFGYWVRALG